MIWDGRYFVTLQLPDGRIRRRDAAKALPKGPVMVLATDNGMQGHDCYRQQLVELRAAHLRPQTEEKS